MRIGDGIRRGNILIDLVRPADFQPLTFSETLGAYVMETLMVSLLSYLLAVTIFHIAPPATPEAAVGFVVSLLGLVSFWTFNGWGLGYAKIAVLDILAGTIIPLTLFPEWLRQIAMLLPFTDMVYTPLAIHVGQITGAAIRTSVLTRVAWGIGLVFLTRMVWLKARRRIEIQGG